MKFIIVGAGNVGLGLAERLVANQHDVTIIEKKESVIQRIPSYLDLQVIRGNACSTQLLLDAGLKNADYLIAASNNDEANISVCLLGKLINSNTKRVVRLHDVDLQRRIIQEKALSEYFDLIIDPDQTGAEHLYRLLKVVGAKDVVEFAGGKLMVLGIEVKENSKLIAKRLSGLKGAVPDAPFLILSVVRDHQLIVPSGKDKLRPHDIAYIVTVPNKVDVVFDLCGQKLEAPKFIVIWGGSELALSLADMLEQTSIQTKLIVPEVKDGGMYYIDRYKNVLVLQGDGTNMQLLVQENISDADVFVAATDDEESNILGSILAKKLGASSTMAMVNKGAYLSLLSTLGVDCVVNSSVAAASAIFRYIHAGSVLSELSMEQRNAGFIEIEITEGSPLIGKLIKDIVFPSNALIAAIERKGEVQIPTGDDSIQVGDVVVVFLLKSEVRKIEKLFQVKLEMS